MNVNNPQFHLKLSLIFKMITLVVVVAAFANTVRAAAFDITNFGAMANDESDDTKAVLAALDACREAGGGTVFVPAGTFIISRQKAESPILALCSNLTLRGEGAASILKYDPKVNQSNFWRMLGSSEGEVRNITIRDLHLDGSNTYPKYVKGETPEQCHGIYFRTVKGISENITIKDCLIENFCGDGIGISLGSRNVTIRDVTLRNFIRQGIQLAGREEDGNYLVTGCQDLEHSITPGGSTIHVEHAEGTKNIQLIANRCRNSILAGGVNGLMIRDNVVNGRIEGNGNRNILLQGNIIRGADSPRPLIQFGYARNLIIRDNILIHAPANKINEEKTKTKRIGIYVWGASRYNPEPSHDVMIRDNFIQAGDVAVSLNGVHGGDVRGNKTDHSNKAGQILSLKRTENITTDSE